VVEDGLVEDGGGSGQMHEKPLLVEDWRIKAPKWEFL
jgi:hypothetical protein